MGKEFLVVDSLPKLEWKLEQETKQIEVTIVLKQLRLKKPVKLI
jgi:GLPGLI family protein